MVKTTCYARARVIAAVPDTNKLIVAKKRSTEWTNHHRWVVVARPKREAGNVPTKATDATTPSPPYMYVLIHQHAHEILPSYAWHYLHIALSTQMPRLIIIHEVTQPGTNTAKDRREIK